MSNVKSLVCLILVAVATGAQAGRAGVRKVDIHPGGIIHVSLGTPGQDLRLVLNTAYGETCVVSNSNSDKEQTGIARGFDANASSSLAPDSTERMVYVGMGKAQTVSFGKDNLNISGLTISRQTFCLINQIDDWPSHVDGTFGLADQWRVDRFYYGAAPTNYFNPIRSMYLQGLILRNLYSLHMKAKPSSSSIGTFVLGGIDRQFFRGEVSYVPMSKQGSFIIDNMKLSGGHSDNITLFQGDEGKLDASASVIYGPDHRIGDIWYKYPGSADFKLGEYKLDHCRLDELPDLFLQVGDKELTIPIEDLVIRRQKEDKTHCYLAIKKFDYTQCWLLGTPFLKNYYTIHDFIDKRIGFATSI